MSAADDAGYDRLEREVAARGERLWQIALALHRDPETAYEEHAAARLLTGELRSGGFTVEQPVAGMATAFVATSGSGSGPKAALLMEYDALPELGHACGHNLIAAAGLGAALAVRAVLGPAAGVVAVGTPAEEAGGGKVALTDAGVFDGLDAALMFHPGVRDLRYAPLTAQTQVRVRFHGRAAHPTGDPTEGVDALAALMETFSVLAAVGRRFPAGSHVQGIVTDGGRATNIVPDLAEGLFGCRGLTTSALADVVRQVAETAEGVARATGTRAEVERLGAGYEHFRDSQPLSERFAAHIRRSGITLTAPPPGLFLGSSDIGNVSGRVPAVHPFVAIVDGGSDHTREFAEAAGGPRGREVMLAAAKALACLAYDVLTVPEARDEARRGLVSAAAADGAATAGPGPG